MIKTGRQVMDIHTTSSTAPVVSYAHPGNPSIITLALYGQDNATNTFNNSGQDTEGPLDELSAIKSLYGIARASMAEYECSGNIAALNDSIISFTRLLDTFPDQIHTEAVADASMAFFARFEHMGDSNDLEKAISLSEKAIKLGSASSLHAYALAVSAFVRNKNTVLAVTSSIHEDTDILCKLEAFDLSLLSPKHRLLVRHARAWIYRTIAFTQSDASMADKGIDAARASLADCQRGSDRARCLYTLGRLHYAKLTHQGNVRHAHDACSALQEAIDLSHGNLVTSSLLRGSLAENFSIIANITQDGLDIIDRSIQLFEQSLDGLPSTHIYRPALNNGLACALLVRHEHTACLRDLDRIIALDEDNVWTVNPRVAMNIATALALRAEKCSKSFCEAPLHRATVLLEGLLGTMPADSPMKAYPLSGLCWLYRIRNSWSLSTDPNRHLLYAREAFSLTDPTLAHSHCVRLSLIEALLSMPRSRSHQAHLDEALVLSNEALAMNDSAFDSCDATCPRSKFLLTKGRALAASFRVNGDTRNLQHAWQSCKDAALDPTARYRIRLGSALEWAYEAQDVDCGIALSACEIAIDLLPRICYFGATISTRIEALRIARKLPCCAASSALTGGKIPTAIELMEQSRGVLWSQSLQLRTSVEQVPSQYAQQLAELSRTLEEDQVDLAHRRSKAEEFETLVQEIRTIHGYDRFLCPLPFEELATAVQDGFAALIIPGRRHCDIVIIGRRGSFRRHVRLAALDHERLQKMTTELCSPGSPFRNHDQLAASRKIKISVLWDDLPANSGTAQHDIFREIWTLIMWPVIQEIGLRVSRIEA
jgi:tetratricopeptide (TPR) repeat protein